MIVTKVETILLEPLEENLLRQTERVEVVEVIKNDEEDGDRQALQGPDLEAENGESQVFQVKEQEKLIQGGQIQVEEGIETLNLNQLLIATIGEKAALGGRNDLDLDLHQKSTRRNDVE